MPKCEKYTKLTQNIPHGHKIYPMAIKYTLQKLPKLGFLA
jgi:hypothetical protein